MKIVAWINSVMARLRRGRDAAPLMADDVAVESDDPPGHDTPGNNKPELRKARNLEPLRRRVENEIVEILDILENAARDVEPVSVKTARMIYGHQNLINCDFHYVDSLAETTGESEKLYWKLDPDEVECVGWPLDISVIMRHPDNGGFKTSRVATVTHAAVRGLARIQPQKMLTLCYGEILNGKWWAENTICGYVNKQWRNIGNPVLGTRTSANRTVLTKRSKVDHEEIADTIGMAAGVALTERYCWHVALGYGKGPRILLPTNPAGCLAMFRDREKPAAGRRSALKHWVSSHYRSAPAPDAEIAYVCQHLRGETRFNWRGLDCEILVSAYDLERKQMFSDQAAAWRAQRKHNQIKFRSR